MLSEVRQGDTVLVLESPFTRQYRIAGYEAKVHTAGVPGAYPITVKVEDKFFALTHDEFEFKARRALWA